MAATTEGLRERKKRQTREAIAQAAMALFVAHGFDAVTVADVARAADVSEKTVFNYFPAKEDLVLHGGEERRAALIEAIRTRAAGRVDRRALPGGDARVRRARRARPGRVDRRPCRGSSRSSRSLRDRLFLAGSRRRPRSPPSSPRRPARAEGDLVPAVVARTLAWTHRLVFRAAFTRLLAGEDQRAVAADLREQARRAYEALEQGLAGYGVEGS